MESSRLRSFKGKKWNKRKKKRTVILRRCLEQLNIRMLSSANRHPTSCERLTLQHIDLSSLNLLLLDLELTFSAFVAHRMRRLQTPRKLIEEIDSQPEPAPRCPSGRIKINVRLSNQAKPSPLSAQQHTQTKLKNLAGVLPTPRVGTSPFIKSLNASQAGPGQGEFPFSRVSLFEVWSIH